MEGKLEISGKENKEQPHTPSATYKQIPEDDMDDQITTKPKGIVKSSSNEPDGADEKMLPDEEKKISSNSNINVAEVKFINNEKQNGDAKLDIGDIKTEFVGMNKEELMKYANDPFWVRLRWCLFILFWAAWVGMLIGAIMIIVAAPKCDPPQPKTWWEQGPLIEIESPVESFATFKEAGIEGFIIPYPEDTYKPLNGSEFLKLLEKSKKENAKVIVELSPSVSDIWFVKSENKEDDYSDYYIWVGREGVSETEYPNNWLALNSKDDNKISAWKYSPTRKQFYLAPMSKPLLNFRNENVTTKFLQVVESFLEAGAAGIRLKGGPNLLVDPEFSDEIPSSTPSEVSIGDYNYFTHTKTTNLLELGSVLEKYHTIVHNKTENGVFMLAENLITLEPFKSKEGNKLIVDLPKHTQIFLEKDLTAPKLKDGLDAAFRLLGNHWPVWKVGETNVPKETLNIVAYLLKGSTIIDKDFKIKAELKEARKSPSVIYGSYDSFVVANNTVFAYVRVHSGNPGYVVAINPTNERVEVNFQKEIPMIAEEVTVQHHSSNYNETGIEERMKISANKLPVSPKSAIVLSYVPRD